MKYNNEYVSGNIDFLNNNKIKINGKLHKNAKVHIIASNPPNKLSSYSGNSLPFPSTEIAFENTVNKYEIIGNSYNTEFIYPNSYYCISKSNNKIPPSIYFVIDYNKENSVSIRIELPDLCQLKTLTHRNSMKHIPEFYDSKYHVLPVATAEKTMKNYAIYKKVANKA
tara:strand:- start:1732 stop:2235 length:504 start_codon:yes stop_codon:yes gene_type:complete